MRARPTGWMCGTVDAVSQVIHKVHARDVIDVPSACDRPVDPATCLRGSPESRL